MIAMNQLPQKTGLTYNQIYWLVRTGEVKPAFSAGRSRLFTEKQVQQLKEIRDSKIHKGGE